MVAVDGTGAAKSLEERVMVAPLEGAVPDRLTVQTLESVPATVFGEQEIDESVTAPVTITAVDTVLPPELAVSVTGPRCTRPWPCR
jgi:hypothetical protein